MDADQAAYDSRARRRRDIRWDLQDIARSLASNYSDVEDSVWEALRRVSDAVEEIREDE